MRSRALAAGAPSAVRHAPFERLALAVGRLAEGGGLNNIESKRGIFRRKASDRAMRCERGGGGGERGPAPRSIVTKPRARAAAPHGRLHGRECVVRAPSAKPRHQPVLVEV